MRDAEAALEKLNQEKTALEEKLSREFSKEISDRLMELQSKLESAEQTWVQAEEELQRLENP